MTGDEEDQELCERYLKRFMKLTNSHNKCLDYLKTNGFISKNLNDFYGSLTKNFNDIQKIPMENVMVIQDKFTNRSEKWVGKICYLISFGRIFALYDG